MSLQEELTRFVPEKDMFLTIGVFDGVHLGHKYLLSRLVALARRQNVLSGVMTFRQHPREILFAERAVPYLTDLARKAELLKEAGVDTVILLTFTREVAGLTARQFVGLLQRHLKMRGLLVGPDFALGRGREGTVDTLRKLGGEMGFSVVVLPPRKMNGMVISSTAIREALAAGDIKKANRLLGRPFSLQGRVAMGDRRGGPVLGFPTINLEVASGQALPGDGVYATLTNAGDRAFQSMTNIGRRPTFGQNERTIETHILNYDGDLYGHEVKIDFIERLRDEMRFASAEELKNQIAEDIRRGRMILAARERVRGRR